MEMYDPPHPGEVLKELYLDPMGLTVTEAADGLGVSRKTLSSLINGRYRVSPEMAVRLSKSFDTSPQVWLGMQQDYDLWQAKQRVDLSEVRVLRHSSKEATASL